MPTFDVQPELFAAGMESTEGPAFDRRGDLYVCDMARKQVYRITPQGEVAPFVDTTTAGGAQPTGAKFHRDGRLFVADLIRREILAVEPDGPFAPALREFHGQQLHGPNDLVFAHNGDLYFTDPGKSNLEHPFGDVYLWRAGGSLERIAGGFALCNGIALADDDRTLFVAETYTNRIHRYRLDADGLPAEHGIFAELAGGFGPDGMALDADGNLYVAYCGKGVVAVFSAAGQPLAELPAGSEWPTNLAFWGESLYVTGEDRVVRLAVGVPGQPLYGLA